MKPYNGRPAPQAVYNSFAVPCPVSQSRIAGVEARTIERILPIRDLRLERIQPPPYACEYLLRAAWYPCYETKVAVRVASKCLLTATQPQATRPELP
jgi:hypothetical protein